MPLTSAILALTILGGPQDPAAHGSDAAKPLVRFIEEVWNKGDYSVIPQVVAPGARLHYRDYTSTEVESVVKLWRTAFPDFHFKIEEVIVQGDKVAARLPFTGTQRGEFWGQAPTGRRINVTETLLCHVKNGQLSECWEDWDEYGMRMQLGLIPAPHKSP